MPPVSRSASLTKMTANCQVDWNRTYEIGDLTRGCAVRTPSDGSPGYVMAGHSTVPGSSRVYVMQTDDVGNPIWLNTYGDAPGRRFAEKIEIKQCSVGYIICGTLLNSNFDEDKGFLLRIGNDGALIWMRFYAMSDLSPNHTSFKDVDQTETGNFIVTGHTLNLSNPSLLETETILMLVDNTGTPIWSYSYPSNAINPDGTVTQEINTGESLTVLNDGYAVVGQVFQNQIDNLACELFTVDSNGLYVWYRLLPDTNAGGNRALGMNAVSNGTLRDLPAGDLVFIGGYQNNAALLRFDNSGTFITAKYFGDSRDQHGTSFHAEAEGNAGFTFVGPSEVAITSGITTTINLDFRVGRTTVGFATGCEEGDFIPTVINREVIPRIILPSFEDVTNRTPRTAIHGPLNWTENVICQNCTCVPVIDISCDYEIAGPGVVIDWDPAPGTITFVEVRRDGELIGTVDGNTFTDDPSPGLHRYEMSFFNNEPSCAPTHSVCDVEVSPSVPIQLVTDLVIRATDENADESTICLVADLEELGRTPQLVTSTELLSAELGSEHPQHNPVAWLLLGEYPHQQPLSDSDNEQLIQYLLSGGSLYIEGADVGFSVSADLQNALGFTALEQGSANGEVPVLEGLNSEHGLDLSEFSAEYSGSGQFVDHLAPAGEGSGAVFQNGGGVGQITAVYHDASVASSSSHRVVTSSTVLSGYLGNQFGLVEQMVASLGTPATSGSPQFLRGDANGDGVINIGDAVFGLGYLFGGTPAICRDALDTNDDGANDIGDPIYSLAFLFSGGFAPPAPFPSCGEDPSSDSLDCLGTVSCP